MAARTDEEALIERSERRWVWLFAAFAALVTTLPYLAGFAAQGPDWRYSGLLIASEDGYSYLAKMLLGSNGDWLFRTPYTTASQTGFLAYLPYILLGKLAAGEGRYEQLAALYHWFRIGGVVAMTWATYQFMAWFIPGRGLRRLGTGLAIFGGGLGFLSLLGLGSLWQGVMKIPLEFYSPETFGFLSALALPHLAWARALLLWGLLVFLRGDRLRSGALVGGIWLLLGLMQPLTVVAAWAVISAHLAGWAGWIVWRKNGGWGDWRKAFLRAAVSVLISAPLVLYNFLAFQFDPFLNRWQNRNLIPSPPLGDYLLAYAIIFPFVAVGIWAWRKEMTVVRILPLTWLAVFPLLAYAPYNLQRRLPEGIWVALCVLAMAGLAALPQRWSRPLRLGLALSFVSSLVFFFAALRGVSVPNVPLFRPTAETAAMDALSRQAARNAVVLASYDTSSVLPTRAAVRVLIGHGPESLGLEQTQPRVEAFFTTGMSDSDRAALLSEFSVSYIFCGPHERALGGWDPEQTGFLRVIYQEGAYTIYHVEGVNE